MKKRLIDFFLGPCIRRIPQTGTPTLYLTFDDGPDPQCTPQVLKLLETYRAHATFFVIAKQAEKNSELLRETLACGHHYGNHSWDHTYGAFFGGDRKLGDWIARGQNSLIALAGVAPVGFRSPAGVRTPPLRRQLHKLGLPLIHWQQRFFDTARLWTEKKALASFQSDSDGAIILLHDAQSPAFRETFLHALDRYLAQGTARGYRFSAIGPQEVARAQSGSKKHENSD